MSNPATIPDLDNKATPALTDLLEISEDPGSFHISIGSLSALYQLITEKDAANGYAGLDSSTLLDVNQIPSAISATKIADGSVDNTEFQFLNGVTANLQTQLDATEKTANKNAASGYAGLDSSTLLDVNQLPTLIPATKIADGSVSNAEFQHLDGVTADIQTQLNATEKSANKGAVSGYAALDSSQELLIGNFPGGTSLQVLRRNSANDGLEFADTSFAAITSLNDDETAEQTLTGGTGITIVDDESGDHDFAIDSSVVTLNASQTLTNKTLTSPDIGNFTSATHNHTNAAGGNQLLSTNALSDTANIAYLNTANTYGAGNKQSFVSSSTIAGININNETPTTTVGGDIWRATDALTYRNNADTADIVIATTSGTLAQFAATTSAELAGVISNETGSGSLVFASSPTLVTPALGTPSAIDLSNGTELPVSGLADDTAGQLITWDSSGEAASVGVGTLGQVLTSAGSGNPPAFQTVSALEFLGPWTDTHDAGDQLLSNVGAIGIGSAADPAPLEFVIDASGPSEIANFRMIGPDGNVQQNMGAEFEWVYNRTGSGAAVMDIQVKPAVSSNNNAIVRFGLESGSTGNNNTQFFNSNGDQVQTQLGSSNSFTYFNRHGGQTAIGKQLSDFQLDVNGDIRTTENFIIDSGGVKADGTVTILAPIANTFATGTATLVSVGIGETVTINGLVYTAVSGTKVDNTKFDIDGNDTQDAADLTDSINNDTRTGDLGDVSAVSASNEVTITTDVLGDPGNGITLAQTGGNITLSASTLTNGVNADTVTLYSNLVYTAVSGTKTDNTQFQIDLATDALIAADLADSIDGDTRQGSLQAVNVIASSLLTVVTITASVTGTVGDSVLLASSDSGVAGRLETSGDNLGDGAGTDGEDADQLTIASGTLGSADRTVSFPGLTINDTFVLLDTAQTLTNKTLTQPVIGNFTSATHDHTNATGGNQLVATTALTASGTKNSTTFLRGDDTWNVPPAQEFTGPWTDDHDAGGFDLDELEGIRHQGDLVVEFTGATNSVNHVEFAASETGVGAQILAVSDDDVNVDLRLRGQGTGIINIESPLSLTAETDANDNPINNLQDPTFAQDAVTKLYDDSGNGIAGKNSARVASTANIVITSALQDGLEIDGITVVENDIVLLKDQTTLSENGLVIVPDVATTIERTSDMDAPTEFTNASVFVLEGTDNAGLTFFQTEIVGTVDTDDVEFVTVTPSARVGQENSWGAFNQNIQTGGQWQEGGIPISPIGKHSHFVSANNMYPSNSDGATESVIDETTVSYSIMAFADAGGVSHAFYSWSPPSEWDPTGAVSVVLYWTSGNGTIGNDVIFDVQVNAFSNDEPLNISFPTAIQITDALGSAQGDLMISPDSGTLTLGGTTAAKGDLLIFRISRNGGNDTLSGTAQLIGMKIFYTTNTAVAA